MKTLLATMLAIACVSSLPAGAATPQEQYVRRVSKIAPPAPDKPKGLCVCQDGLEQGGAGYLRQTLGSANSLYIHCFIPGFDLSGNEIGGTSCDTFVPLVK